MVLDFFKLPHLFYAEAEFEKELAKLNARLADGPESLFKGIPTQTVPADDFAHLVKDLWKTIKDQNEINLPSQRALISSFRCNEIKETCMQNIRSGIAEVIEACQSDRAYPEFEKVCIQTLKTAIKAYTEQSKFYLKEVIKKYQDQLQQESAEEFQRIFHLQMEISMK